MIKITNHFNKDLSVKVIKDSTTNFLFSLPDGYLDMVYIDADHSYTSVLNDLRSSYPKIKTNGFICGHDYIHDAQRAINDFCTEMNLNISYLTNDGCPSFCIIKQ